MIHFFFPPTICSNLVHFTENMVTHPGGLCSNDFPEWKGNVKQGFLQAHVTFSCPLPAEKAVNPQVTALATSSQECWAPPASPPFQSINSASADAKSWPEGLHNVSGIRFPQTLWMGITGRNKTPQITMRTCRNRIFHWFLCLLRDNHSAQGFPSWEFCVLQSLSAFESSY